MTTSRTKIPLKPLNNKNARILFAAMFCFVLGATGSFVTQRMGQAEVNEAVSSAQIAAENAQTQAQNIRDTLCYNKVDKKSEICIQAQKVIDDPKALVPPIKGDPGSPGLGIVSSVINTKGELVVTYTDGKSNNLGKVVGADGKTGGTGATGAAGTNGTNGTNGANGISVTSQTINDAGHLIVTYSNGVSDDLGYVVGPTGAIGLIGPQGATGATGAKGETGAAGAVGPQGPAGADGQPGAQGIKGDQGDTGQPGNDEISSFTFADGGVTYICEPNPPGSSTFTCTAVGSEEPPVDPPATEAPTNP